MEATEGWMFPSLEKWVGAGALESAANTLPVMSKQPALRKQGLHHTEPSFAMERFGPMRGKGWSEVNWRSALHLGQPSPDSVLCPISLYGIMLYREWGRQRCSGGPHHSQD